MQSKIEDYFGYKKGTQTWKQYFDFLNSNGKITARANLEMFILLLEYLEEKETNPIQEATAKNIEKGIPEMVFGDKPIEYKIDTTVPEVTNTVTPDETPNTTETKSEVV